MRASLIVSDAHTFSSLSPERPTTAYPSRHRSVSGLKEHAHTTALPSASSPGLKQQLFCIGQMKVPSDPCTGKLVVFFSARPPIGTSANSILIVCVRRFALAEPYFISWLNGFHIGAVEVGSQQGQSCLQTGK